jgi:hypothetical protein
MRRQSWSVLLGIVFGATLGFAGARGVDKRAAAKGAGLPPLLGPGATASAALPQALNVDEWQARLETINWERPDGGRLAELQQALVVDSKLREAVLNAYRAKTDPRVRSVLRRMLTADAAPEMIARATEMVKSRDKQDRATGFELMAELPPTNESTALAKRALTEEQDPSVLAAVLLTLRPRVPPSPHEIAEMVPRFRKLVGHDAILVRAHSVQLIAEWDKAGETAESVAAQAFADSAPLVRQAAVGAVMIGQFRSERVKRGLLDIIRNPIEDMQTRFGAQQALERFDMSTEEYETFMRARGDIEKKAAEHH